MNCEYCNIKLSNNGPTEIMPHYCECDETHACMNCFDMNMKYNKKHTQYYCGKGQCDGNLDNDTSDEESE